MADAARRQPMPWSNQGGGPWGSGGGGKGPWGSGQPPSGPTPPDLEEFLRRSQDKLRTVLPGGSLGGKGLGLIVLAAIAIWLFSGFFRVEPDELGVVLRFGAAVREVKPGLNYHLPYPIETALTPKALRVNKIDVGMRVVEDLRRGTTIRDVPEESLMLTGDENIVDVDFSVLWKIKPEAKGVENYLFNIQQPEGTVKAVPEARGKAAQITQSAEAYREQTVAEAKGATSRFLQVYDEYKKAPDVTRQRMYLETMERLFGGTDKIILDQGGVVPYLPLDQ